ncbi:MAG: ABC transporter ATP-binding protein [Pontibacterium sp.]
MTALLSVNNVACAYGPTPVVANVSFEVQSGEIACLLGPSGCGKTTLLRGVAGFVPLHAGEVILGDEQLSGGSEQTPPEQRQMGMVFQDYALFPHLTVAANIAFGLAKWPKAEREARVDEMLALVRLAELKDRYPHELSGGQQQRIALARALAPKPKLLLMDEPFSNLDTDLRRQLSLEVREILKSQGIAAIVVTHDQHEAFVLGDKVGILAEGKLQQWAAPDELYHRPANIMVANFVGEGSLLNAERVSSECLHTALGEVCVAEPLAANDDAVSIFIRPCAIRLLDGDAGEAKATVLSREFLGKEVRYRMQLEQGVEVDVESQTRHSFAPGDEVNLMIQSEQALVFAGSDATSPLVCRGIKATEPSVLLEMQSA